MNPNQVPFTIRPYQKADLARLYAIDQICFPPTIAYTLTELRFYLSGRRAIGLVAEASREIAGFAVGRIEKNDLAHIITLDILPEVRRKGIGRALMEELHKEFDRLGAACVFLEVSVNDLGAKQFYENLGYLFVDLLPGYYSDGTDACLMIRPVTGSPPGIRR